MHSDRLVKDNCDFLSGNFQINTRVPKISLRRTRSLKKNSKHAERNDIKAIEPINIKLVN